MNVPTQSFALELDGTEVPGTLHLPVTRTNGQAPPRAAVLACGLPAGGDGTSLSDDLRTALGAAGVAMAEIANGSPRRLADTVDLAAAALHALAVRDDIDVHRLGVLGYSLGAVTAACLSGRSDQLARVALFAPVSTPWLTAQIEADGASAMAQRLGAAGSADLDDLGALDPQAEITRHERPVLILHGAADRQVPVSSSIDYLAALEAAGRRAEHLLIARADHGLGDPATREASMEAIARFFAARSARPLWFGDRA